MPEHRYVVVGLGAIGGTLAGSLSSTGREVVGIARPGAHLDAIRAHGLVMRRPNGDLRVALDARQHLRDVDFRAGDTVVVAVKSQDTEGVLRDLHDVAPPTVNVVCAQNGVANEVAALRLFEQVYGAVVRCPALYLEPGVVVAYSSPTIGLVDVGRYPSGTSATAEHIAADLEACGYSSRAVDDVARWKYAKLISNLGNAVEVVCGPRARGGVLTAALQTEAVRLLEQHGIGYVGKDDAARRERGVLQRHDVNGPRPGGSVWQSVERKKPSEVDYLCGEIALLARRCGGAAPANALVQQLTHDVAAGRLQTGALSEGAVLHLLEHNEMRRT